MLLLGEKSQVLPDPELNIFKSKVDFIIMCPMYHSRIVFVKCYMNNRLAG